MNSLASLVSDCHSMICRSHCRRSRFASVRCAGFEPFALYIQCAAMPHWAVSCISCVRIWISSGLPCGPMTVVCSDWYMLNLGMAM